MSLRRASLELIATVILGLILGALIAAGLITSETAAAWVGEFIRLIREGI
jgi:hypothetical protein